MTIVSMNNTTSDWYHLWTELEAAGFVINDIRNARWLGENPQTKAPVDLGPRCNIDLEDKIYTAEQLAQVQTIFDKWQT